VNSYSYSQLSAAYRCNQYFKLLYVDRLKPPQAKSDALHFGSSMHSAIEEYLTHGSNIIDSFHAYWSIEADKIEFGRYSRSEHENMAEILLTRFERKYAKKIKVHQQEVRLFGNISEGIRIEGTPDLLGDYEGVPSVIDFKTSASRYPKEKVFLGEQMPLYAHLAKQNGYNPTQVVYIIFVKGQTPGIQVLTFELKSDYIDKVLANVRQQCENLEVIRANNSWTRNTNSCLMGERKCDFFNECWKEQSSNE
jgi:hypothetical protein